MEKKFIEDKQGNKVLPITHVSAVLDDSGNDIGSVMGAFEDEVRGMITTPNQGYVTVEANSSTTTANLATVINTQAGDDKQKPDTIYRVSNWDGSQYIVTSYSEYAYNGSNYVFLCQKSQIGEVFDITVYNSNTKYADLSAALGTNGANIPDTLRKGGMSVKFVQSSDNNYTQFRCKTQSFSANPEDWAFEGDDILVENPEYIKAITDAEGHLLGWIRKSDGGIDWAVGVPKPVKTYVDAKVAEIWNGNEGTAIDGLSKVIAFLDGFVSGSNLLEYLNETYGEYVDNPEFINAKTDKDDKILEYYKTDGTKGFGGDVEVGNKMTAKEVSSEKMILEGVEISNVATVDVNSIIEDPEDRIEIKTDYEGKIISYRKADGTLVENVGVETPILHVTDKIEMSNKAKEDFALNIKDSMNMPYMTKKFNLPDYGSIDIICELFYLGTDNKEYNPTKVTKVNDIWYVTNTLTEVIDPETGEKSYEVNENSIATTYTEIDVDMENTTRWPVDKTKHYCKVKMKFSDIDGTWYAQVSFQGSSTLNKPKKGLRITTYKNSAFSKKDKIKIGDMVATSKFNCKAYYGDPTRIHDIVLQRLIIESRCLRQYNEQYPWNGDYPFFTGAVGTIQSFPVLLTTSGNFYGVSMMGLAKDKANFMLNDDEDGMMISGDWVAEGLLRFDEFHPETWTDEMNDIPEGEHTPSNLAALTSFWDWINNGVWTKETASQHLSVIDWIDYYIFVQVFRMRDNDIHNIMLYTKSDKQKFYAFLYDLDLSWRNNDSVMPINDNILILWKKIVDMFWDEIVDRYWELRNSVLNYNHVSNVITSIQSSIPYSDMEKEMEKWSDVIYDGATSNMLLAFKNSIIFFDGFFIK